MSGLDPLRHRLAQVREGLKERRNAGYKLLSAFGRAYPEPVFVQIGANDGAQSDYVGRFARHRRWRSVLVEPNPRAFERLAGTYAGRAEVTLVNAAIAAVDGRVPFYEIQPPASADAKVELIGSYDLLGSLSLETLRGHAGWIADLDRRIVASEVTALRFASLLDEQGLERVDLLAVDTEGYDFEILKQLELERVRPRVLVYEHSLLSRSNRVAAQALMREAGYEPMEEFFDTWCVDATIDDALLARWRRLRPARPGVSLRDPGPDPGAAP